MVQYNVVKTMKFYLALGSNQGDQLENIKNAILFLQSLGRINRISSIYKTSPVEMSPGSEDFLNLVLELHADLSPESLLDQAKKFEQAMGRDLSHSHFQPRKIDIDILMAEDQVLMKPRLQIPHREMARRSFVLTPLCEIAPEAIHPVYKIPVRKLLTNLSGFEKIKKVGQIDPVHLSC